MRVVWNDWGKGGREGEGGRGREGDGGRGGMEGGRGREGGREGGGRERERGREGGKVMVEGLEEGRDVREAEMVANFGVDHFPCDMSSHNDITAH